MILEKTYCELRIFSHWIGDVMYFFFYIYTRLSISYIHMCNKFLVVHVHINLCM